MGFWDGQHKRKNRNTGTGSRKPGPAGPRGQRGVGFNQTASGDYDMTNKRLVNCADGTADKDAVTKKQMETYVSSKPGPKGDRGIGFNLTSGGDYDMQNKKLVNCADGTADKDAVTKKQMETYVNSKPGPAGPAGVGFTLTPGGDYDMKSKKLVNCADGTANKDAVTKQQMETYVSSKPGPKGDRGIGFNLTSGGDYDMQNKKLVNCADGTADKDAVTKKQMETYVSSKPGPKGDRGEGFNLTKDGDYDMKSKKLVNCADGTADKDAVNKKQMTEYVDSHLSHSISTNLKNDLLYVMDPDPNKSAFSLEEDILGGGFVDKNLHTSVKLTAQFILTLDAAKGYYSSRLGVNVHPIPVGEYTLVCEMLWDSKKIDKDNVTINATSSIETVSRQRINRFDNHVRAIIHFHKWNNPSPPNDLQLDIHMKNKTGESYDARLPIFIVIYGSKGYHNDIPTSVWDRAWFIEKGVLTFSEKVVVQRPTNDGNPVTKLYLEKSLRSNIPRKIWYRGALAHLNSTSVAFHVNGASNKVKQSANADFTVNSSDKSKIYVKNPGMYMITYTDGVKTDNTFGWLDVVLSNLNTYTLNGKMSFVINNTNNSWKTMTYCFMAYFNANTWMQIRTLNSLITLGQRADYNRLLMVKVD